MKIVNIAFMKIKDRNLNSTHGKSPFTLLFHVWKKTCLRTHAKDSNETNYGFTNISLKLLCFIGEQYRGRSDCTVMLTDLDQPLVTNVLRFNFHRAQHDADYLVVKTYFRSCRSKVQIQVATVWFV